jgi:hypothetical protein
MFYKGLKYNIWEYTFCIMGQQVNNNMQAIS